MYHANTTDPTIRETIQLLEMLQFFGWYRPDTGKDDYACTTNMIDQLTKHLQSMISTISIDDRVDLAITLRLGIISKY